MTKTELFIELASPNEEGKSRWVLATEFTGKYADLQLGNGGSWCRASSSLAKKYIIEFDKEQTKGNSIDAIRLAGFNKAATFNHNIRKDIKEYYKTQRCVMLGVCGFSENTKIEIDHKDGRKEDWRVSNQATQQFIVITGGDSSFFATHSWVFGLIVAILIGLVIVGGIKSIAKVTTILTPTMCAMYIISGLIVIGANITPITANMAPAVPSQFFVIKSTITEAPLLTSTASRPLSGSKKK